MLQGHTALHEAVTMEHKEIVSKLCEKNADINAVTNKVHASLPFIVSPPPPTHTHKSLHMFHWVILNVYRQFGLSLLRAINTYMPTFHSRVGALHYTKLHREEMQELLKCFLEQQLQLWPMIQSEEGHRLGIVLSQMSLERGGPQPHMMSLPLLKKGQMSTVVM